MQFYRDLQKALEVGLLGSVSNPDHAHSLTSDNPMFEEFLRSLDLDMLTVDVVDGKQNQIHRQRLMEIYAHESPGQRKAKAQEYLSECAMYGSLPGADVLKSLLAENNTDNNKNQPYHTFTPTPSTDSSMITAKYSTPEALFIIKHNGMVDADSARISGPKHEQFRDFLVETFRTEQDPVVRDDIVRKWMKENVGWSPLFG